MILTSGYSTVLAKDGAHGFELLQNPIRSTSCPEHCGKSRSVAIRPARLHSLYQVEVG